MERLIDLAKVIKQAIKRTKKRIQISGSVFNSLWEMLKDVMLFLIFTALYFLHNCTPREEILLANFSSYIFIGQLIQNMDDFRPNECKWIMKSIIQGDKFDYDILGCGQTMLKRKNIRITIYFNPIWSNQ